LEGILPPTRAPRRARRRDLRDRLARLENTLSDEDFESWQDWINKRLTAEEAAKILHEAVQ
jgi:hypothetical protein